MTKAESGLTQPELKPGLKAGLKRRIEPVKPSEAVAVSQAVAHSMPVANGLGGHEQPAPTRTRRKPALGLAAARFPAKPPEDDLPNRQAELFYLQKQIQAQTPMVFILEDGEKVEGVIQWYDRNVIKVRGRDKVLVYKSAIKYLYKAGEPGHLD